MPQSPKKPGCSLDIAAAQWQAKRDRGMTATEQDAYLQWLTEDTAHGAAILRLDKHWKKLDQLCQWRPVHSPRPNPDLLAPKSNKKWRWPVWLAAAASIAIAGLFFWPHARSHPRQHQAIIHPGPERLVLEDGSIVDLNAGAKIDVRFTPEERRVQLVRGEAHFSVAKNVNRPFIVSVNKFAVRAVGTAFSVSVDQEAVSVLVTEGKVRLDKSNTESSTAICELSHLIAGQKAVINIATPAPTAPLLATPTLQVCEVTPAEVERALSWQGLRLEFVDMPLGEVIAEFNRYNVRKFIIADAETAAIVVGGNFRADNIDAFVRLLATGFDVSAKTNENQIALRRSR